ncbi:MAG: hypothetical protein JRN52_04505 [Nitrososphaerota archaeon]|nr:hypothetical protein [Nitrososphaerota archaeon]
MPKRGWTVVTVHANIHQKVVSLLDGADWNEPRTLSAFVEQALIKEIDRVEKQRKLKTQPPEKS